MANAATWTSPPSLPLPREGQIDDRLLQAASERTAWSARIDQLLRLRNLPDDWDGLGAETPRGELVDAAIKYLCDQRRWEQATPPDHVIATTSRTVVLEWHVPGGYLELEFVSPTCAEATSLPPGATKADVYAVSLH